MFMLIFMVPVVLSSRILQVSRLITHYVILPQSWGEKKYVLLYRHFIVFYDTGLPLSALIISGESL